ncbi:MAG: TRAP transporter substrate-binding protein DctP, partial [Roseomonas sp.]|nr:TRAP transporter substrate-binding protein DctP [Roseomonas sp.]
MKLHRRDFLAGAAGLAALAPSFGHAQTRWQMATPYADGNLHTRNIRTFIEDIQKASNGQLNVQLHSNGALLKMPEIKRGVQTGQVQLGEILLTAYANEDPLFDADALPQLVVNYAQAKRLSDLQRPFIEA